MRLKTQTQQQAVDTYNLERLSDSTLSTGRIVELAWVKGNEQILTNKNQNGHASMIDRYNDIAVNIRTLRSNITSAISLDDRIYLDYLLSQRKEAKNIEEKFDLLFKQFDTLNQIRDNKVAETLYATHEGSVPGALSQYISQRIKDHDSNFILGMFGKPRTGKSFGASRLGINITKLTGQELSVTDVVYSYEEWLNVKSIRRANGTLKGSVQIIDEAGDVADATIWWEKEIVKVIKHLRRQGFDNTCTIIVSPLFSDVTNRARGLVHAIMIPWREWGKRYMEVTDTGSIDFDRHLSYWYLNFLDTDPMSNKTYRGKLKAALGDVVKINTLEPPKEWIREYTLKSEGYKKKEEKEDLISMAKEKAKHGDYNSIIRNVLNDLPTYLVERKNGTRTLDLDLIKGYGKVGLPVARVIRKMIMKEHKDKIKKVVLKQSEAKESAEKPTEDIKPTSGS